MSPNRPSELLIPPFLTLPDGELNQESDGGLGKGLSGCRSGNRRND